MKEYECTVNPVSSRICEKGTRSCTVYHTDRTRLCRKFHELTGGHWHEFKSNKFFAKCPCGKFREDCENPTYEHADDVLKVLDSLGKEKLEEFVSKLSNGCKVSPDKIEYTIDLSYIIKKDALLKAAVEFLDEREPILVDRSHEECGDCTKRKLEPPICKGHVQGPTSCRQFQERTDL